MDVVYVYCAIGYGALYIYYETVIMHRQIGKAFRILRWRWGCRHTLILPVDCCGAKIHLLQLFYGSGIWGSDT